MSPDMHTDPSADHLLAPRARTTVLADARLVLPAAVVRGWVAVAGDRILDLGEGAPPPLGRAEGVVDLAGDHLLPGLVELHTDHLEVHLRPRPGVRRDPLGAALAYDAQIAASGITTVFDSLRVGDEAAAGDGLGGEAPALAEALERGRALGLFRADHRLHLRCEVPDPGVVRAAEALLRRHRVHLLSLMDHTPGQRQFRDVERFHAYASRHGAPREAVEAAAARRMATAAATAPRHRAALAALAAAHAVPLASHDDTTAADVAQSVAEGATVAEFPTTMEAAEASRARGLAVVMGAPNLLRGGSHSGNVAAEALARRGLLDVMSSDYVPGSLLEAAFRLAARVPGVPLPRAVATVTRNPARAVGLADRGEIAPGRRADLVRVRLVEGGLPVVRQVWRGGERVI
jgi:alpha-D-ribose 1-methylphosphonate 5-triphosphate diphosphatase